MNDSRKKGFKKKRVDENLPHKATATLLMAPKYGFTQDITERTFDFVV